MRKRLMILSSFIYIAILFSYAFSSVTFLKGTWGNNTRYNNLSIDVNKISASKGGKVMLSIDGGWSNSGRTYLILGSITGDSPGITLPGGEVLPIVWDLFTNIGIQFVNTKGFSNFWSKTSKSGTAYATFDTMNPLPTVAVGLKFYFAEAMQPIMSLPWTTSNSVTVEVVP